MDSKQSQETKDDAEFKSNSQSTAKTWTCNECQSVNNVKDTIDTLNCTKCNHFITSLNGIKLTMSHIITNSYETQFLEILNLFNQEEFIKYHSISKLENLLLYSINLVIQIQNNNNQSIQLLQQLAEYLAATITESTVYEFPCQHRRNVL